MPRQFIISRNNHLDLNFGVCFKNVCFITIFRQLFKLRLPSHGKLGLIITLGQFVIPGQQLGCGFGLLVALFGQQFCRCLPFGHLLLKFLTSTSPLCDAIFDEMHQRIDACLSNIGVDFKVLPKIEHR